MFGFKNRIYKQIVDSMADSMYLVDKDQKIQYWNNAAESLTGLNSDEMIGRPCNDGCIAYEDEHGKPPQPFEHPAALCFQKKAPVRKHLVSGHRTMIRLPLKKALPLFTTKMR